MKRLFRYISAVTALAVLTACPAWSRAESAAALPQLDDSFTERDLSGYCDPAAVEILLTGSTAETRAHVVTVEGGEITILDGGIYAVSGTLSDGSITVDVDDDERVQLILCGANIASSDGPAIRVKQADKVFITLAEGTENALTSAAFSEEGVEAVIYSDEGLTFNGAGTLSIASPAGDGIDGKDDVKFTGGTYVITAAGRGIDANDSIRISDGDFTITTDGDAIRAQHENNAELGYVHIWGGSFTIITGGGAANGADHAEDMGGMGPGPGSMAEGAFPGGNGERPTPPDFDGEMPMSGDFSDERPASGDLGGAMPVFGESDGEMPAPPDFGGETAVSADADDSEAEDAVSAKGIKASGDIVILGGSFTLDTADDALHADGDLTVFDGALSIASGDDGLHADNALAILGGTTDIAQSYEGMEAKVIAISGGDTSVTATDDGMNAADGTLSSESFDAQEGVCIRISGGSLTVNAGGDGIDSNGDIVITGGSVVVSGPQTNMNGSIDYNGTATISGGTLIAAGASGMTENFSEGSAQPVFLAMLSGGAGEIAVTDQAGNTLLTGSVEKAYEVVVISCPGLVIGETYTVSNGEASTEITLTDAITGSDTGSAGLFDGASFPNPGEGPGFPNASEEN